MGLLSLSTLVIFFAVQAVALAPLPLAELRRTGLSDAELRRFADPHALDARATTAKCSVKETFPAPTPPSIVDLVKRNSFVTRKGSELFLAGQPFRMVGTNIYWLGLDENEIPDPSYPSQQRILEAIGIVNAMRGTTIRAHTLGVSFGNPLSVEPDLDVFNEKAYDTIDFAILVARIYGIKLLIPLVDNYNWYHGGKYQFIGWHGIPFNGTGSSVTPDDVGTFFYNTTAIVDSFKRYIKHHLNHVNKYTGIAIKDDPTILGYESGNELSFARFGDGPPPPAWTKEIAQLVKSIAPHQLFQDGTYGIFPDSGQLQVEEVDIFSDHFYPANISKFQTDWAAVKTVNKNFFSGEIDWTGENGGDDLTTFLATIKATPGAGSAFWSVFAHNSTCCTFVEHDDGFSFYYQRSDFYVQQGDILINHATEMNTGLSAPEILPQVACPLAAGNSTSARIPAWVLPPGFNLDSVGGTGGLLGGLLGGNSP